MKLCVHFDANFNNQRRAMITGVVIRIDNNEPLKINRLIKTNKTHEGEFRALNHAVCYLNSCQKLNHIPYGCDINIFGDAQNVVYSARSKQRIKDIKYDLFNNFIHNIEQLSRNNNVELHWVPREFNREAHRAAMI